MSFSCTDTPRIRVTTPMSGYHDVPCGSDPAPGGCATPLPTINAGELPDAKPLEVTGLFVPIDHTGAYAVDVGDAVLPNGILSEATVPRANDTRSDLLIPDGIRLELIGEDGTPIENAYTHGWRPGVEHVHVRLVYTVEAFDPGATLILTSIVVR